MNAGSGLIHEEMPDEEFLKTGGIQEGIQIWINLPASERLSKPDYADTKATEVPETWTEDGLVRVRVLAGKVNEAVQSSKSKWAFGYFHLLGEAKGFFPFGLLESHAAMVYALVGEVTVNGTPVPQGHTAFFLPGGGDLHLQFSQDGQAIVLHGKPVGEPIARYGPFVMNTQQELREAVEAYQDGRFGNL
jgi:quercetin 2,3-dioxygenase